MFDDISCPAYGIDEETMAIWLHQQTAQTAGGVNNGQTSPCGFGNTPWSTTGLFSSGAPDAPPLPITAVSQGSRAFDIGTGNRDFRERNYDQNQAAHTAATPHHSSTLENTSLCSPYNPFSGPDSYPDNINRPFMSLPSTAPTWNDPYSPASGLFVGPSTLPRDTRAARDDVNVGYYREPFGSFSDTIPVSTSALFVNAYTEEPTLVSALGSATGAAIHHSRSAMGASSAFSRSYPMGPPVLPVEHDPRLPPLVSVSDHGPPEVDYRLRNRRPAPPVTAQDAMPVYVREEPSSVSGAAQFPSHVYGSASQFASYGADEAYKLPDSNPDDKGKVSGLNSGVDGTYWSPSAGSSRANPISETSMSGGWLDFNGLPSSVRSSPSVPTTPNLTTDSESDSPLLPSALAAHAAGALDPSIWVRKCKWVLSSGATCNGDIQRNNIKKHLEAHLGTLTSGRNSEVTCRWMLEKGLCGTPMKLKSLAKHVMKHTDVLLRPCPECGQFYSRKDGIPKHLKGERIKCLQNQEARRTDPTFQPSVPTERRQHARRAPRARKTKESSPQPESQPEGPPKKRARRDPQSD